jgi:hypothetical protein
VSETVQGALIAAIDAPGWAIIIGAVFLGVTKIVSMVLDYLRFKANRAKAEEVAATLEEATAATTTKLEEIAKVGVDTHTLVNSNMAIQLKLNVVALGRIKDMTRGEPGNRDDVAAWESAVRLLREHEEKQKVVDAITKPPRPRPEETDTHLR